MALGYANLFRLGRPQAALESLARAIALDPDLSMAHYLPPAVLDRYISECTTPVSGLAPTGLLLK